MRRLLLSVSWASAWANDLPALTDVDVQLFVRRIDWQLSGRKRLQHAAQEAWRTFVASRGCQAVVVSTTSLDAVLLAILLRLRRRQRLVVYDFLLPRSPRARLIARFALARVDVWLVIRRGDAQVFSRTLAAADCRFVPFPAHHRRATPVPEGDSSFAYAAGTAYRDWPTLVSAAVKYKVPTLISTPDAVDVPPAAGDLVTLVPLMKAEEGRQMIALAAIVCVPLQNTDLPAGPLVVLDGLAAGKPVVASDVNGTRDYIIDGVTGVLVPPGDVDALGSSLRRLLDDVSERDRIGLAGLESANAFAPATVLAAICREAFERR